MPLIRTILVGSNQHTENPIDSGGLLTELSRAPWQKKGAVRQSVENKLGFQQISKGSRRGRGKSRLKSR
jgi:hypothetical protein